MLNNDFKVLTQKYARYKKQKRSSRNKKIALFVLLGAGAYYLFTTLSFTPQKPVIKAEHNVIKRSVDKNISESNHTQKAVETDISQLKINERSLQVTTENKSLEQLLKNQKKLNNYSSTISLANYHYSKKEYQETIKWAIEASKKNKSKARPWILYAKSKKALGKVDIAKKALTLFLKNNKSQEAKTLLESF